MRTVAVILLLVGAFSLRAQDYLVTLKNDTLRGSVRILSYDVMDRAAVTVNRKKHNFTAVQVRSIFKDSATYSPIQHEKKIRFMKVLRSGYLSLYGYRQENQSTYDSRLLSKMNGTNLDVPNLGFKRILSDFLSDCEASASRVKEGEFQRNDLEGIVDDYNKCVAEQNKVATAIVKPTPALEALSALREKVKGLTIESKKDVIDMLNDVEGRMQRGQEIPAYLTNGIKSALTGQEDVEEELNKFLALAN